MPVTLVHQPSMSNSGKKSCRKPSFFTGTTKYGGMDVPEAKQLRKLERENAELKKMVAEQALIAARASRVFQNRLARKRMGYTGGTLMISGSAVMAVTR